MPSTWSAWSASMKYDLLFWGFVCRYSAWAIGTAKGKTVMSHAPHSGVDRLLIRPQAGTRPGPAATDGQIRPKAPAPNAGPVHMRVTSIATGASLNTRPDVPPAGETPTTTQPLNAPSRHSNCCAHTHSASTDEKSRAARSFLRGCWGVLVRS